MKKNIKTIYWGSFLSNWILTSSLFCTMCPRIVFRAVYKMYLASCCYYGKRTTLSIVEGSSINMVCCRFYHSIYVCRGTFKCLFIRIFLSCAFVSNLLQPFIFVASVRFLTLSMTLSSCFACIEMLF